MKYKIVVSAQNTKIGLSPDGNTHVCSSSGPVPKIKHGSVTTIEAVYGGMPYMDVGLHHFNLVPGSEAEHILAGISSLPEVTILLPGNSDIDVTVMAGTVDITVPLNVATINHKSTGEVRLASTNDLTVINHHTGDLVANSARICRVTNTNTGNVDIGNIMEELTARNTSSGNVEINHIIGAANIINTGDGDVMIYDGHSDHVIIRDTGNGSVDLDIKAKVVSATNQGNGRVYVHHAEKHDIKSRGTGSVAINTPL